MHHHLLPKSRSRTALYEWRASTSQPFNELLLSWNAARPLKGHMAIEVAVRKGEGEWSQWLRTAEWGAKGQRGFVGANGPLHVDQDLIALAPGEFADAFAVRVIAEEGASLDELRSLHACTTQMPLARAVAPGTFSAVELAVPGLSQRALSDSRRERLCSPTSLSSAIHFLEPTVAIDPIAVAEQVWDADSDIFGNWSLNVAAAGALLGPKWSCWIERIHDFSQLLYRLHEKTPVIISIRGPLVGSPPLYSGGHLLVVKGWDPLTNQVLCMDPGFFTDETTDVRYPLEDLLTAWNRRRNLAYVFQCEEKFLK